MKPILLIALVSILSLRVTAQISEGNLYRENSKPEVYVIHDGKKIWIPTPDALFGMGYDWNQVKVVPDGSLNNFPTVKIESASATPGSLIFPPDIEKFGNIFKSHYPIKISTSTRVLSRSHVPTAGIQEIQLAEIRGWLLEDAKLPADGKANLEGAGYDLGFGLIPDYKWLKDNNIDINKVIRVGNIVRGGIEIVTNETAKSFVAVPAIHVELNSWGWRNRKPVNLPNAPSDWITIGSAIWPFNPDFKAGQYVSIYGSLVTDDMHCSDDKWGKACDRWAPHLWYPTDGEHHYARYTEIHPPDKIRLIDERPQTETTYGLVMYADPGQSSPLSVSLSPKAPKPPGAWRVAYEEIIGPESVNPNSGGNCQGRSTTRYDDRIEIKATTCGGGLPFGGPGRMRALYRLWWEPKPPEPPKKTRQKCLKDCDDLKKECQRQGTNKRECAQAWNSCIADCPLQ